MRVVHHSLLERRGGSARIAQVLAGQGGERTFEVAETAGGAGRLRDEPPALALARAARDGAVVHLHGSGDWPGLLAYLQWLGGRTVLTLHDAGLLTGGCLAPQECAEFGGGCAPQCPRGFGQAASRRRMLQDALERLDPVLVSPTRWLAGLVRQAMPLAVCQVVPNGVAWPDVPPDKAAAKASLGLSAGARLVLFAAHGGREAELKAGGRWMEMWRRIKAAEPRAVGFMVGGRGQERHGDLFLWPYLDRDSLARFMAAADVLAYPSRADNHPLVVLEAQAAGACVVASAVGGIPEQIYHGRTGILVRGGEDEVADAAARLLGRPRLAATLGRQAFDLGRGRFDERRMLAAYRQIYAGLRPPRPLAGAMGGRPALRAG